MNKDLLTKIRESRQTLTAKERIIADYLLLHAHEARYLTESEIEQSCKVSRNTVTRFVRSFHYRSFACFRDDLELSALCSSQPTARDWNHRETFLNHRSMDQYLQCAKREQSQDMQEAEYLLDTRQMEEVIFLMGRAEHIWFYGEDPFSDLMPTVAEEFSRFSRKFEFCRSITKLHNLIMDAGEKDLFLIFDYKGSSEALCRVAKAAKSRRAHVVVVTRYETSPLCQLSHAHLLLCGQRARSLELNLPVLNSLHFLMNMLLKCYAAFNYGECQRYGIGNMNPEEGDLT